MPSRGIVVGCIFGGLTVLGNVATITFLQLKHSVEICLGGRPEDPSTVQSDSPPDIEDQRPDLSTGQTPELETYAEAVQAVEQAKEVIAGRCVRLLTLPIEGLLDVANACSVSSRVDYKPA